MLTALLSALSILTPCEYEDSTNCYWSGGANSQGQSFIDLNGTAYYLEGN